MVRQAQNGGVPLVAANCITEASMFDMPMIWYGGLFLGIGIGLAVRPLMERGIRAFLEAIVPH